MVDTVDTVVVSATKRKYTIRILNISDATGETLVKKLDLASAAVKTANGGVVPTACKLVAASWDIQGFSSVRLFWDHTTDDEIMVMAGQGSISYEAVGGLMDPRSSGGDGSVLLTTAGAAAGNTYDITLVFELKN